MTSRKLYLIMLSLVSLLVIAILAGAWLFNSQFQTKSAKLVDQRRQIAVLNGQQAALTKAKQDIKRYNQLASIAKSIVPQDKSQAETVREIVKIAHANGVNIGNVTFPTSDLGGKKATNPKLSQLESAKGIPGVYSLEISVASDKAGVPYSQFIDFLKGLENNRRTALVSAVSITPAKGNKVTFNLTLEEYIKP